MNINALVEHIRNRCPAFERRVTAGATTEALTASVHLPLPFAVIMPEDDAMAGAVQDRCGYFQQDITESFTVLVVVSNLSDERGQTGLTTAYQLRDALFKCLLGMQPDKRCGFIHYTGSEVADIDRAKLLMGFTFAYEREIEFEQTLLPVLYSEMKPFNGADIKTDIIDPAADPAHPKTGKKPGPDGRIEHELAITFKGDNHAKP